MVEQLSRDDAQTFIDRVDGVSLHTTSCSKDKSVDFIQTSTFCPLGGLAPEVRRTCVRYLYKICGRLALLPKSLAIPLDYDPTEHPLCCGGSADVWKGQSHDREVAAKVLRVYSRNDRGEITRVGRWLCPWLGKCTDDRLYRVAVLQGGCGLEGPPPSERAPAVRRDGDR